MMINHMDHRICWDVLGFIVMFECPIFGQHMRCLHGHVVSVQSLGKQDLFDIVTARQ